MRMHSNRRGLIEWVIMFGIVSIIGTGGGMWVAVKSEQNNKKETHELARKLELSEARSKEADDLHSGKLDEQASVNGNQGEVINEVKDDQKK